MQGEIRSVEVTYFIHATEDGLKVEGAVMKLLGTGEPPETEELEGHFGNRIMKVRVHLTGSDAAAAVERMVRGLGKGVLREVASNLTYMVDEHSALHLRLDKQSLVAGIARLGSGDAVKVKVKPRNYLLRGGAREFYLRLLGVE